MAARENQGLHIALIVFVALTIMLAVSTFIFFKSAEEIKAKIADNEKRVEDANKRTTSSQEEGSALKRLIGVPASESLKSIEDMKKKDFTENGFGLADDKQNYRTLVLQLAGNLKTAQASLKERQSDIEKLKVELEASNKTKVTEIVSYTQTVDKTGKDLLGEREEFGKGLAKATESSGTLSKQFDKSRKEYEAREKKILAEKDEIAAELVKTKTLLVNTTQKIEEEAELSAKVDGVISWVNQQEHVVWLNLGSADGLKQQTTFKVIDADETDPVQAKEKANVEVIRVLDAHLAEARIVKDDVKNPIAPGDKVFSIVYQPGRKTHFALIGFMDIDGDGESDRAKIKNLIRLNSGTVDVELTDDGKIAGELTLATDFYILGDRPDGAKQAPDFIKNYSSLIDKSRAQGVRKLNVGEFLDFIGYQPEQRTVALGKKARPDDFKAKLPESPRASIGKPADFTPIVPPGKQTSY